MDVVVKGRHCEVPDRFRQHVSDKLAKVEKLDGKVIRIDVEVVHEPNPRLTDVAERVELTCRSRGPVIRAEAAAQDAYAALDCALAKLENRLRRAADRRRVHYGTRAPVSVAAATAPAATALAVDTAPAPEVSAPSPNGERLLAEDGPFVVREKVHEAAPMTLDQALHEMELVGHDFFLFEDADSGEPSVLYRRRGYDYGILRLRRPGIG